jgi:uncharacterized peroxidase-related enzyme
MSRIEPLATSELTPEMQAIMKRAESSMGFTPNDALIMMRMEGLMPAMSGMVGAIYRPGKVSMELKRLVALVSSSAAGCQYCTAHNAHGADMAGVDAAKLAAVWDFRSSPLFSDAERAALDVAASSAQTPNAVTDEEFAELKRHYSDEEALEIVAVLCLFGFLNRWNHTLATELESSPLKFAEQHLREHGWDPGVHAAGT